MIFILWLQAWIIIFFIVLVISLRYIYSEKKIIIEKKRRGDILGIVRSDTCIPR
jgi:preprotein translocase subunit SecG